MIRVKTYYDYRDIPLNLVRQWCRMHIQEFPHVPRARKMWQRNSKAVLCLLVENNEKVLAWSMYIKKRTGLEMYTYTRRDARGKGYGKRIAATACKRANLYWKRRPHAKYYPHDKKAQALYSSLGWFVAPKKKQKVA